MPQEPTRAAEPHNKPNPAPDTPGDSPGTLPEGREPLGRRESTPAGSQITTPASATPPIHDATGTIPGKFGRYELEREIARGGMGAVFAARDTRFDREVAVKLLLDHHSPGSFAARRFISEARITGQLQHPGIPAAHDLGVLPDGRPFMAMKLIKGRTLDYLLKQRENPTVDRGRFLAVFEGICQAVGYAHAHRVIHRDLKPLNVMVGAFGEVQVMDWGLAKVIGVNPTDEDSEGPLPETVGTEIRSQQDEDEATRAGSVLGTPAYMPPEQAIGAVDQIDTRSDVFGLGAILCVIMTGKPPFVGSSSEATRQLAARGQLGDAFGRLDTCEWEAELVALCKQCLSVEKADRPNDARKVAEAIQKFRLESETRARQAELDRVHAEGEVRAAELKATELRKRRRVQLALAGAVGLLLLAGAGFAWWQEKQTADRRRVNAELREAELNSQLADEQERSRLTRNRTDIALLLEQCEAALRADDAVRAGTFLEQAQKRADEGGADEFATLLAQRKADLTMLRDLDRIDTLRYSVVRGQILGSLEALAEWPSAFARYGIVPGGTPVEEVVQRVKASPLRDRLLAALDQWHTRAATPALLAILVKVDPDEFRDAVRLAIAVGARADLLKLLPHASIRVGSELLSRALPCELSRHPKALEQPPRFAAELGDLGAIPAARRLELLLAAVIRQPADYALLMTLGALYQPEAATTAFSRMMWYRAAVAARPTSAAAYNNLGLALSDRDHHDRAIAAYAEAIRIDPQLPHPRVNIGVAYTETGRFDLAIAAYQEAIRLAPQTPEGHLNLGNTFVQQRKIKAAREPLYKALELAPNLSLVHNALGNYLVGSGDIPGAIAAYQKAIELDPADPKPHYNLGRLYSDQKDVPRAIASMREAMRLDPDNPMTHSGLGSVLLRNREPEKAAECFRNEIKLRPENAVAHGNLGNALFALGDTKGAIASFRESIRLNPQLPEAYTGLGAALFTARDLNGAATALTEAIKFDPTNPESHYNLGLVRRAQKNPEAALVCFRETVRLNPKFAPAHNDIAIGLYLKQDFDGAIAAMREAIKYDPNEPGYRMNLDRFLKAKAERDGKSGPDPKK